MKYQYAINQHNQTVSIANVKNRAGHYVCVSCGGRMAPRLGEKNEHHFYHLVNHQNRSNSMRKCTPETYLHRIAKKLFEEAYCSNEPFILRWESKHRCANAKAHYKCFKTKDNVINLIEKYTFIDIEKRDGSFIPDVLLRNRHGEKLYIEFAHTHFSSQKKLLSGEKMIEIAIKEEADIERIIQTRNITETSNNIDLYGFISERFDCGGACVLPIKKAPVKYRPKQPKDSPKPRASVKYRNFNYLVDGIRFFVKGEIPNKDNICAYEIYLGEQCIGTALNFGDAMEVADVFLRGSVSNS